MAQVLRGFCYKCDVVSVTPGCFLLHLVNGMWYAGNFWVARVVTESSLTFYIFGLIPFVWRGRGNLSDLLTLQPGAPVFRSGAGLSLFQDHDWSDPVLFVLLTHSARNACPRLTVA